MPDTCRSQYPSGLAQLGGTGPRIEQTPELRRAIADYLQAARGVRCNAEQIVVTAGTQQAVDLAIRVLLAPGEEVWVEDPGYFLTHPGDPVLQEYGINRRFPLRRCLRRRCMEP